MASGHVNEHTLFNGNKSFLFWIIPKPSAPAPLDKSLSSPTTHEQICWNDQVTQGVYTKTHPSPLESDKLFIVHARIHA